MSIIGNIPFPDTQLSKQQNDDAIIRIDTAIQIQQKDKFNKSVVLFLAGTDRSHLRSACVGFNVPLDT